jgi:hypothetical protein
MKTIAIVLSLAISGFVVSAFSIAAAQTAVVQAKEKTPPKAKKNSCKGVSRNRACY